VSVIEGKDVFRDPSALPNAFAVLSITNDRDAIHQTKVSLKGSNPQFSETFFLYITYDTSPFAEGENTNRELMCTVWYIHVM
jgi:hypothetical protein